MRPQTPRVQAEPATPEDSYPYLAKNGICKASGCTVGIPAHGVTGYQDVKVDDEQSLMDAVSKQPVSVAIEAHDSDGYVLRKSMIGCCFPVIFFSMIAPILLVCEAKQTPSFRGLASIDFQLAIV